MILLTLRIKCKVKGWYYEKVNKKNFRTIKKQKLFFQEVI